MAYNFVLKDEYSSVSIPRACSIINSNAQKMKLTPIIFLKRPFFVISKKPNFCVTTIVHVLQNSIALTSPALIREGSFSPTNLEYSPTGGLQPPLLPPSGATPVAVCSAHPDVQNERVACLCRRGK